MSTRKWKPPIFCPHCSRQFSDEAKMKTPQEDRYRRHLERDRAARRPVQIVEAVVHERASSGLALCGHAPPASQFFGDVERMERRCAKCDRAARGDPPLSLEPSDVVGPFNEERAIDVGGQKRSAS